MEKFHICLKNTKKMIISNKCKRNISKIHANNLNYIILARCPINHNLSCMINPIEKTKRVSISDIDHPKVEKICI